MAAPMDFCDHFSMKLSEGVIPGFLTQTTKVFCLDTVQRLIMAIICRNQLAHHPDDDDNGFKKCDKQH